jgi:hypothetical protein
LATTPALAGKKGDKGSKTVDCNKSRASVQKKVDSLKHDKGGTIFIRGFCNERVTIVHDGIRLSGNEDGDGTIDGGLAEVVVTGAQRVEIEYLVLSGEGYGVLVQEGASARISHNEIRDNVADGVGVYNQAFARVEFNTITGNGRPEYYEAGIEGGVGAKVRSRGNYVADNAYAAVEMGNLGYIRSGSFVPPGGTADPADRDVFLQKGCIEGQTASECEMTAAPGTISIDCFRGGICDFRNTDVVGASFISGLSNFDVRNSLLHGNVGASGGSRLNLRSSVSGSGYVNCYSEAFASNAIRCDDLIPTPE